MPALFFFMADLDELGGATARVGMPADTLVEGGIVLEDSGVVSETMANTVKVDVIDSHLPGIEW